MTARQALAGGTAYVVLYLVATTLLPAPEGLPQRILLASLFFLLPSAAAGLAALQAAGESRGAERAFWGLLSAACFAQASNVVAYALYQVAFPDARALFLLAHLGYHTQLILATVALFVRPDRPLGPGGVRAAALEWVAAAVAGYFLIFYFLLLPTSVGSYPWFLVYTLEEMAPALVAARLALRVKQEPFRSVYRLLAVGFGGGALAGIVSGWVHARDFYVPTNVAWILAFVPLLAATRAPRGAVWVRSPEAPATGRRRSRLAALAVAAPPLLDMLVRGSGFQAPLADARSQLALGCSAVLSILVALRVGANFSPAAAPAPPAGDASELLQLASGAAHEINNPLMAVTGWAELGLRRGGPTEKIDELLSAVRAASHAVSRLQRLARSEREPGGGGR
jgi:signal transduction histidine kinase